MARFSFCGGSYTLQSINADNQRCVNLYPEADETGEGRSKLILLPTPGLISLTADLDGPPRAQLEFNGRLFVIAGTKLYEVKLVSLGFPIHISLTVLGTGIANDGLPASMAANELQLLMCSAGSVYLFTFATNAFVQVPAANFTLPSGPAPVIQVAFCDSFFLALIANSQTVQISNVLDGVNWNLNGQIVVSVFPDNIISMIVDHRELGLIGRKKSVVYVATGSLNVFDPQPGGFIEQGGIATFGASQLDNSVFWVGGDDKGSGIGWRLNGYTPVRITTHAVELAWKSYPRRDDAVSYAYQSSGHSFWQLLFPSANNGNGATWDYDTATGLWHERDFLNVTTGANMGHPSWNHSFWNGVHLVGDWRSNKLYQMDEAFFDNNGVPITRVRRAPHISTELETIKYSRFILDMETGLGTQTGAGSNPLVYLRWSDDGGHTWSSPQPRSAGVAGAYKTRIRWARLGRARVRTYEVSCSEPIPIRFVDAYVNASPGYEPSERLPHQIRKVA